MQRGLRRGLAFRMQEIALHRFPDGELRVTVGPAAPTTIIYAPLDRPNDKLIALLFAAEALRRGGAKRLVLVAPYLCYMRQDVAFRPGEAISQRSSAGCWLESSTASSPSTRICIAPPTSQTCFPASRPTICRPCRRSRTRCAPPGLIADTVVVGPDAESEPWVSDLASRLGVGPRGCAEDPPRRPLGRDRIRRPAVVRRPASSAGRRYRLVGRHVDRLRQGARGGGRRIDRRHRHPCAVSRRAWQRDLTAPASAPSARRTACRTRPMRSRSTTSLRRRCAAKCTGAGLLETTA